MFQQSHRNIYEGIYAVSNGRPDMGLLVGSELLLTGGRSVVLKSCNFSRKEYSGELPKQGSVFLL